MRVLLDSVILIDHFNGINEATDFLSTTRTDALISVITRAEVLTGFDSEDETAAARGVLDLYQVLSIDSAVADLAATLRRDYRWKLPDALQARPAVDDFVSAYAGGRVLALDESQRQPRQRP